MLNLFVRGRGGIPNLPPYVLRHIHNPLQTARGDSGSDYPKSSPMLAQNNTYFFQAVTCIRFFRLMKLFNAENETAKPMLVHWVHSFIQVCGFLLPSFSFF